jgi:hypothetical protein
MFETDEQFDKLIALLNAHRSAVDEIAFFTDYWHHNYHPLDRFAKLTATMARRVDTLHSAGYRSVGINVLDTLGHIDEAWDFLPMPFPTEMRQDGTRSKSRVCPSSPEFNAYIPKKYELVAQAKPDFIWVDDLYPHAGNRPGLLLSGLPGKIRKRSMDPRSAPG